ncbi:MAG: glycosyltransferase family 2 protein [Culicoidibacterales bacterium]
MVEISLIIPIYNVSQYLPRCLAMITNQTNREFEVIFINDGSTDQSDIILQAWIDKQDKNQRYVSISQQNQGLGAARNRGIELAKGRYFWCIDSDDFIDSNAIDYLITEMNKTPGVEIFGFNYEVWPKKYQELRKYPKNTGAQLDITDISACDKIISRQFWINHQFSFPEGYYYEDTGIIPIAIEEAQSVRFLPEYLYYYEVTREEAITKRTRYERLQDFIVMQKRICDYYLNKNELQKLAAYEYQCIHTIMGDILVRNIGATEQIRSENFKAVMVFFETYFPKWQQNHQLHQNSSEAEWILKNLPLMKESQYANIKTQNYLLYDRNKTNNNKKGELSE